MPTSCLEAPSQRVLNALVLLRPQTCRQIGLRGNVHWQCATRTDPLGTAVEVGDCVCDGTQDQCLHDRR